MMDFDDENDELFKSIQIPDVYDIVRSSSSQNGEALVPEEFPFPFTPYDIQVGFMKALYQTLHDGKIGIFESPTGTGKSLSLICGALKWLKDFGELQKKELEELLSSKDRNETEELSKPSNNAEFDWIEESIQKKEREDKARKLKEEIDERIKREARLEEIRNRSRPTRQLKRKREDLDREINDFLRNQTSDGEDSPLPVIPVLKKDPEDENILVDDYNSSDETNNKNENDDGDNDKELNDGGEDIHVTKIYFCSRTHSQLAQFVREIQQSPYRDSTRVVTLGSRQNLCINPLVKQLKSMSLINEKCKELQKNKSSKDKKKNNPEKCPYYKQEKILDFRDKTLMEVQDIEQLVNTGKRLKACPYYGTRYGIPAAELLSAWYKVVALPYNLLLHKSTREACGIKLKDNIILIDEAHNLVETINNVHSIEINGAQLVRAHSQLSQYLQKYLSRLKAANVLYIKQLLFILSNFIKILKDDEGATKKQGATVSIKTESTIYNVADFVFAAQISNLNIYKIIKYCEVSQISRKLHGFVEKYNPPIEVKVVEKKETMSGLSSFLTDFSKKENLLPGEMETTNDDNSDDISSVISSPLMHIESFISSLMAVYSDSRIVIHRHAMSNRSTMKYLLLNPADHFKDVLSEARSVIVAGGTMEPISEFKDQLFKAGGVSDDRITHFSCGHVIPEENLLPISLAKGPSGVDLDFTYQSRDKPVMLDELGRVLCNLCNVVPGGVVVFFPSYDYEKCVYSHWTNNGVLKRMASKKRIFREPKSASQVQGILLEYTNCIRKCQNSTNITGAILFSVVGGKMSEGINFSDDLGRCVVMVGLPYPNLYSLELKEKMDYLNSTLPRDADGKLPGQLYYENLCMKAVNQSIGRAIRNKDDFATILLLDQRYVKPSIISKLPNWISRCLKKMDKFGPAFSTLRTFYTAKKTESASSESSTKNNIKMGIKNDM